MRFDYITRLVQICLDISNVADERGEQTSHILKNLDLDIGH